MKYATGRAANREGVMDFTRREFVKGFVATSTLVCSGFSFANNQVVADRVTIEKAIKASFGGGFSLVSYSKSGSLTKAQIENFGNQYTVTSLNLFDWNITQSSLIN